MISVIVPSYKPQDYLWDCLDSIRNQSLDPSTYETIIVLNGCNQPYYQQIENYIANCDSVCSIRLIQTDIPGVSHARNMGIEASKGEFLTFIDDDDLISSVYLEELLKVSGKDCIGCSNSYRFEDSLEECTDNFLSKAYKECKGKPYTSYRFRRFLSPPYCKLIHKDIIGETRFPVKLAKSEDSVFCLRLTPKVKEMRLAGEEAIYYQRHRKGSVMRRKNSFGYEFAALCKLEWAYLTTWFRHPFQYSLALVISRMVAGFRNFLVYIS